MKYFNMLKPFEWMGEIKKVEPTPAAEPQVIIKEVPVEVPQPVVDNTANEEILGLLRSLKDQIKVPKGQEKKTILNEHEVNKLVEMMVKLQDALFPSTPISSVLVKQFIWNIPREIYDISIRNFNANKPPCMNPMYWFYAFCIEMSDLNTEERELAFINAMATAIGSMEDSDYQEFMNKADDFETLINGSEGEEIPELS